MHPASERGRTQSARAAPSFCTITLLFFVLFLYDLSIVSSIGCGIIGIVKRTGDKNKVCSTLADSMNPPNKKKNSKEILKNLLTNFPTYDIIGTEIERENRMAESFSRMAAQLGSGVPNALSKNLKRKLKIPLDKTSRV